VNKIGKKPSHWPFVPSEKQIEGLKFVVEQFSIKQFERSLDVLVWFRYMSKSKRKSLLRRYRKIAGISYDNWRRSRK